MRELLKGRLEPFLAPQGRGGGGDGKVQQPQRLTNRQRRAQARDERTEAQRDEKIRQGRIRALKWVGGAALGAIGLASAAQTAPGRALIDAVVGEEEFSGEVVQTRENLDSIHLRVGRDMEKLKEEAPLIVRLAVSYYSTQMSRIVPENKDRYNRSWLKSRIFIISDEEFIRKNQEDTCFGETPPATATALTDLIDEKSYVCPERDAKNAHVSGEYTRDLFLSTVHELMHLTPKKKLHNSAVTVRGISSQVELQKGFISSWRDEVSSVQQGKDCFKSGHRAAEEYQVIDSSVALCIPAGLVTNAEELNNTQTLRRRYAQNLLVLFNNDYKQLVRYQQLTDFDGFIEATGRKVQERTRDPRLTARSSQEIGLAHLVQNVWR